MAHPPILVFTADDPTELGRLTMRDGKLVASNDMLDDIVAVTRATMGDAAAYAYYSSWSNGYLVTRQEKP